MSASGAGPRPIATDEPTCPQCGTGHAAARGMRIGHGVTTMTYVCEHCQHRWDLSAPDVDIPQLAGSFRGMAGDEGWLRLARHLRRP
jgi:hypothetical protein